MAYPTGWKIKGVGNVAYNVNYTVGLGGANYTDDVMLVQFFLMKIFADPIGAPSPPNTGPMKVDGVCGPITCSWIRRFQTWMQSIDVPPPSNIKADSRVSRAPDGEVVMRYTIVLLNREYGKRYPQEDVAFSDGAPPYLRKTLAKWWIETHGGGV